MCKITINDYKHRNLNNNDKNMLYSKYHEVQESKWELFLIHTSCSKTRYPRQQRSGRNMSPPILNSISTAADDDGISRYLMASFPTVGCDYW